MQDKLTPTEKARLAELLAKVPAFGGDLNPAQQKELDELLRKEKLTEAEQKRLDELFGPQAGEPSAGFDTVFDVLSGATIAFSVRSVGDKPMLSVVAALAKAPSAETAEALTRFSPDVKMTIDGTTLTATSPGFEAGGKLADDPLFQRAFAGAPPSLHLAAYAQLAFLKQESPFEAVSVMAGVEGDDQVTLVRVLIG